MEQDNTMNTMGTQGEPVEEKSSLGAIAAIIIIVVLIVLGGFYIWTNTQKTPGNEVPATQNGTAADSSEAANIQAELNSIDVGADSGITDLESQL